MEFLTDFSKLVSALQNPVEGKLEIRSLLLDIVYVGNSLNYFCISKIPRIEVSRAHNLAIQARKTY